jgi:hypothetical protein
MHANLILLRLLGLAAGRSAGGSRRIPLSPRGSRMTCTIRHPKARAASMNSSRAPARSGRMPTSESWRPPPSREEPTTGTDGGLHGFKTLLPDLRPHHHETGELNLNHPIGARRSIPLRCCASTTSAEPPVWTGPISLATAPRGRTSRSSATPSAATSLSMSRLYVDQRIRGGLSGVLIIGRLTPSLRRADS